MPDFSDIRPYEDREVTPVIERLLLDRDFLGFIGRYRAPFLTRWLPGIMRKVVQSALRKQLDHVSTVRDFQEVVARYVVRLLKETTTAFSHAGLENLSTDAAYLFVSNHRDIAADSMLVNYALFYAGHGTVRIALGDNLIQKQFATDLMRLNKSFIIRRSVVGAKKVYAALLQSSRYIHHSLSEGYSIWIAQSEGRAKDGIDRTDSAVVKMFMLSKRKAQRPFGELIESLNIVPVSISYEYDPCDLLKAKELYYIDQTGSYTKPEGEDLISLAKGLGEFKGEVNLRFCEPIKGSFETPDQVADELDRHILSNYHVYPSNYIALSQIEDSAYRQVWLKLKDRYAEIASQEKETEFANRLDRCPTEHRPYFLKMYANPLVCRDNLLT
ncbi:MAG: 1-acyl-sn-glycerol-3-phosphate acyltransferase [Pseudomonadales bacterium]|jgi:1-acyl-sn-glycerol-3-phosphate acyltransferase|nr:1-acyl-sn-glycerol-3-phosphate acyltransferase [Pseudomonadales bacterium]MDP7595340.1 1-acyl-sn-glycerol-3-phosphate acyltransferase [Pseudomonadales bacterium]HJN53236.1 1-acyl-sn-glycerol-3-phosphate acyltransferase [Pseudomonadales bacterium]|tara:strand:+ start:357 stop:1511 length:1155 start_codon:yes stop_codon:yes gene_type:complete